MSEKEEKVDFEETKPRNKKKKIIKVIGIIFLVLLAVILCVFLVGYNYFHSKYSMIYNESGSEQSSNSEGKDYEEIVNANPEIEIGMEYATKELESMDAVNATGETVTDKDVFNVLLIGTDERTNGEYSENARGDACMLLSINTSGDVPTISVVSLERGMGVPILEGEYAGQWDWLTHTFRYGGAELLMAEVSECFKIDVHYYVRINFNFFIRAINTIGGVTVYFDEEEANFFITCGRKNVTVGENHIDGQFALDYARLRSIDSDWVRIQRQREIVLSAFEQCRNKPIAELDSLLNSLLPLVQTNIPESEIARMMLLIPELRGAETQQMTIPVAGSYGKMIGMGGRSLFAVDFEKNSQILQEYLYPQKNK